MPIHDGLICIAFRPYEKIHISKSIAPRVMGFGHSIDMDDPKVDLKGRGQRSPGQKTGFQGFFAISLTSDPKVQGHMGQGQRSHGSN